VGHIHSSSLVDYSDRYFLTALHALKPILVVEVCLNVRGCIPRDLLSKSNFIHEGVVAKGSLESKYPFDFLEM
jgi:hypothetical protein